MTYLLRISLIADIEVLEFFYFVWIYCKMMMLKIFKISHWSNSATSIKKWINKLHFLLTLLKFGRGFQRDLFLLTCHLELVDFTTKVMKSKVLEESLSFHFEFHSYSRNLTLNRFFSLSPVFEWEPLVDGISQQLEDRNGQNNKNHNYEKEFNELLDYAMKQS